MNEAPSLRRGLTSLTHLDDLTMTAPPSFRYPRSGVLLAHASSKKSASFTGGGSSSAIRWKVLVLT